MSGSVTTVARGENHYAWKGDDALSTTKRERAQAQFSLDGVTCEHDACDAPAVDRHHVDGDTGNNVRENLRFLCRRHHMEEDGRLDALRDLARSNAARLVTPPRPCVNCGVESKPLRRGLCHACNMYQRRTGRKRPVAA